MSIMKNIIYRLRGEVTTKSLQKLGLKVGRNFHRQEHCIIDQSHCWLIEIGDNVTLAPRVHILAHDASMFSALGYTRIAPVHIGNNVFVGAGSIILPGVVIGDNVVIGAGSVVTHDILGNSVVAGNPAKTIEKYEDFIAKHKENIRQKRCYDESFTLNNPNISDEMKHQQKEELCRDGFGYIK